jgi:NAD-dependent DNA ligase
MRSIDVAKKFGSVKEMWEANEKAWLSIPGIGKQTVKSVMEVLHN